MTNAVFEYDAAISFAREDRTRAEELGRLLESKNINILYSEAQGADLGGGDFVNHIAELYRTKAQFCLMLISRHYPLKRWTEVERTDAQEHALRDAEKYILPIRLDDVDVPGLTEVSGYRSLEQHSLESVADFVEEMLARKKEQSGPPSQSHDLRSGNVPSAPREAE